MSRLPGLSRWLPAVAIAIAFTLSARPVPVSAQTAAGYFEENCAACHTIGEGELNGPDLKGITELRDPVWLRKFITDPEAMVKAGDATAIALLRKYEDALMPTPENLTPQLLEQLIQYMAEQSGTSAAADAHPADAPFGPDEAAAGEALFAGRTRLSGGGVACIACHGAGPRNRFGGGQLGPDLTGFHIRAKGRRGTMAWLGSPATPIMRKLFGEQPLSPEEIRALAAFLEISSESDAPRPSRVAPVFLLSGLVGAVLGLVVMDRTWKGRLSRRGHR